MTNDIDLNKLVADLVAEHGIDDSVAVVSIKRAIAAILRPLVGWVINKGK